MKTQSTAVSVIVAEIRDLCKEAHVDEQVRTGPQAIHPPSLIVTLLILKNLFGFNSERSFLRYLGKHHQKEFPSLPERSWFNRKAKSLVTTQQAVHELLLAKLGADQMTLRIVDTTPVPVVKLYRSKKCQSFVKKKEVAAGYCASKKMYYYGQKLTLLITAGGIPTGYALSPANHHDLRAFKEHFARLAPGLESKTLIADKGYYDGELEVELEARWHTTLVVPEKKRHQKRNTKEEKTLLRKRGLIETVNHQLQDQMSIDETRARSQAGLVTRIQSAILSFAFGIYWNQRTGRAPLALKSILI